MQEVTLTIEKSLVWHEVAKATAYIGNKMVGTEDDAYERISIIDKDKEMLERWWVEACSLVTLQLKEWVDEVASQELHHDADDSSDYHVTLRVADLWPTALKDSLESDLRSFVIATVLSKWHRISNKEEVEAYGNEAASHLVNAEQKLFQRKRPSRP